MRRPRVQLTQPARLRSSIGGAAVWYAAGRVFDPRRRHQLRSSFGWQANRGWRRLPAVARAKAGPLIWRANSPTGRRRLPQNEHSAGSNPAWRTNALASDARIAQRQRHSETIVPIFIGRGAPML